MKLNIDNNQKQPRGSLYAQSRLQQTQNYNQLFNSRGMNLGGERMTPFSDRRQNFSQILGNEPQTTNNDDLEDNQIYNQRAKTQEKWQAGLERPPKQSLGADSVRTNPRFPQPFTNPNQTNFLQNASLFPDRVNKKRAAPSDSRRFTETGYHFTGQRGTSTIQEKVDMSSRSEMSTSKPHLNNQFVERQGPGVPGLAKVMHNDTFGQQGRQYASLNQASTHNYNREQETRQNWRNQENFVNYDNSIHQKASHDLTNFAGISDQMSKEKLQEAFLAVHQKIDTQVNLSTSIEVNDLYSQTLTDCQQSGKRFGAEYAPLRFIPTSDLPIPREVKNWLDAEICQLQRSGVDQKSALEPQTEISLDKKFVMFAIGTKFIVWDYSHQFSRNSASVSVVGGQTQRIQQIQQDDQLSGFPLTRQLCFNEPITCFKELRSANMASGWRGNKHSMDVWAHVLVATTECIQMVTISKPVQSGPSDYRFDLCKSTLADDMIHQRGQIRLLTEFEKIGRVFCANDATDGKILEINFQTCDSYLNRFMQKKDKRMTVSVHNGTNMLLKLIPTQISFFGQIQKTLNVIQIKIDEQRNMLYSLAKETQGTLKGQTVVDVFFLGLYGDQFQLIKRICQWEIITRHFDFLLGDWENLEMDKYDLSAKHKIISIEPILPSESQHHNLMCITESGRRIFIEIKDRVDNFDDEELESLIERQGLQSEVFCGVTPHSEWIISGVLEEFPNQELVSQKGQLAKKISECPYQIHHVPQVNLIDRQQSIFEPQYIVKDHKNSLLVYCGEQVSKESDFGQNESQNDSFTIVFLQKNAAKYSMKKQQAQQKGSYPSPGHLIDLIREEMSLAQITKSDSQSNEKVLEISQVRTMQSRYDSQILLGCVREPQIAAWGKDYVQNSQIPSSVLDRQGYLQGGNISLLTNERLIQIQQIRPIDKLFMLLSNLSTHRTNQGVYLADLEDFIQMYTVEETCSMLVQILCDSGSVYQNVRKETDLKNVRQKANTQLRNNLERSRMDGMQGSRGNTLSLPRARQHGTQTRQWTGFQSQNRSISQQRANYSQSQLSHEVLSILHEFTIGQREEIDLRKPHRDIYETALNILSRYGDTIMKNFAQNLQSKAQMERQRNLEEGFGRLLNCTDERPFLDLFTNKHRALYQYLQRILMPVWNLNVTNMAKRKDLKDQKTNKEILLIVRPKIVEFSKFLAKHEKIISGITWNDPRGITDGILAEDIEQAINLEAESRDLLEVAERQSLRQLKVFLKRCIDSIEFIVQINSSENKNFVKILNNLSEDQLIELHSWKFSDLLVQDSNPLVRILLEESIKIYAESQGGDNRHTGDLIRNRVSVLEQICPTLVIENDGILILGESLLATAGKEKDQNRKNQLIKEACNLLGSDPKKVNLDSILKTLVLSDKFEQLVHLCLRKAKALESEFTAENKEDQIFLASYEKAYDIIIQLCDAIDFKLQNRKSSYDEKKMTKLDDFYYFHTFLKQLQSKVWSNPQSLMKLLQNIVQIINQQKDQVAMGHLFRQFLLKESHIDFMSPYLSDDFVNEQIKLFIQSQTTQQIGETPTPELEEDPQKLTLWQFEQIQALLMKRGLKHLYSDLVIDIAYGEIILKKRLGERSFQKIDYNCEAKVKLVEECISFLGLSLSSHETQSLTAGETPGMINQSQITGQIAHERETLLKMSQYLETLKELLFDQTQTIISVKEKLKVIQLKGDINEEEKKQTVEELQRFQRKLNNEILKPPNLLESIREYRLLDRQAFIYLRKIQVEGSQAKQQQLVQKQLQIVKELFEETRIYYEPGEPFKNRIKQLTEDLFPKSLTLTQNETSCEVLLSFFSHVITNEITSLQSAEISLKNWPIRYLLSRGFSPNTLYKHFLAKINPNQVDAEQKVVLVAITLVCLKEWLTLCNKSENDKISFVAKQEMNVHKVTILQNIQNNGVLAIYQTVDFVILLDKSNEKILSNLFKAVDELLEPYKQTLQQNSSVIHINRAQNFPVYSQVSSTILDRTRLQQRQDDVQPEQSVPTVADQMLEMRKRRNFDSERREEKEIRQYNDQSQNVKRNNQTHFDVSAQNQGSNQKRSLSRMREEKLLGREDKNSRGHMGQP